MTENERRSLPLWKRIIAFIFGLILLAAQGALIYFLYIFYATYTISNQSVVGYIYLGIEIYSVFHVLYVIHKPMSTNYKLTWSILILVLPVFFVPIYFFNSTSRRLSKRKRNKIHKAIELIPSKSNIDELADKDLYGYNFAKILADETFAPTYSDSKYIFFKNCEEKFKDMVEEIKKAKDYIYLEFFIIAQGQLMNELYETLLAKGKEGVKIRILYDDVGSLKGSLRKLVKKISQIPNCEIARYQPLGLNFNFLANYRDHRKITVIDGIIAYCGGDNLADEYIHKKERFGYWRDNCGKFIGRCAFTFTVLFSEMWYTSTKKLVTYTPKQEYEVFKNEGYIIPFGDGPLYKSNSAYDLFTSMISKARKSLYISTPYFIIDDTMINLIALKCKEGVDVRILMPKIPDKKMPFYMGRENYREILKYGGKIYEFTPGFNHAKNIIVDNKYAFIGTINMDYRSLFLHYECGALVIDSKEIYEMCADFLDTLNDSELVSYEVWKKRPTYQKLIAFILNLFAPMF